MSKPATLRERLIVLAIVLGVICAAGVGAIVLTLLLGGMPA